MTYNTITITKTSGESAPYSTEKPASMQSERYSHPVVLIQPVRHASRNYQRKELV